MGGVGRFVGAAVVCFRCAVVGIALVAVVVVVVVVTVVADIVAAAVVVLLLQNDNAVIVRLIFVENGAKQTRIGCDTAQKIRKHLCLWYYQRV